MLSKHRVMSPATRRIAGGATLTLAIIGLGMTASGTKAAETIRTKVETATGVDIASVDAQAADVLAPVAAIVPAQAATLPVIAAQPAPVTQPAIPAAPLDNPTLPAKPAIAAPATRSALPTTIMVKRPAGAAIGADNAVRKIVIQQYDGNGKLLDQSVNNIPEIQVTNANCGPGTQTSMTRTEGGKQVTVVCSDRIRVITRNAQFQAEQGAKLAALGAARAAQGRAQAMQGEAYARQGLQAALAGLRSARASIVANSDMPAGARTSALQGIDDSIREVQAELSAKQ